MTTVFVAPHNDDETLFGGYLIQKHRADVVVVLRGEKDRNVPWQVRARESARAVQILGGGFAEDELGFDQWRFYDDDPDWKGIRVALGHLADRYDLAIVPAVEDEPSAHDQHNRVGELSLEAFGPERCVRYLTYTRQGGRSTHGDRVFVENPMWISRKLAALAVYETQIVHPATRPHFERPLDEYVLP